MLAHNDIMCLGPNINRVASTHTLAPLILVLQYIYLSALKTGSSKPVLWSALN